MDWDCKITGLLKENWRFIAKFVENLAGICVNRCYFYDVEPRDHIVSYQLHGFSDASEKTYGRCVYLKCITKNNFISSALVPLKSRVTPISRLILTVLNAFQGEFIVSCLYAWTHSQVSLAWIKALHKEFQTFVQNRVVEIRKSILPENGVIVQPKLTLPILRV